MIYIFMVIFAALGLYGLYVTALRLIYYADYSGAIISLMLVVSAVSLTVLIKKIKISVNSFEKKEPKPRRETSEDYAEYEEE